MIIKNIRLNAFGPFKNEISISFNELNQSGLFLITGPTGVGKTSIFDAISFALYGEISSFGGSIEKVRSDYAKSDSLTFVELEFELNNVLYFIRREPKQMQIGRLNAEVNHPHTAILKFNEELISGVSEVNKKIIEIIGLDANLFRQVAMIPQGEFLKLLTSSSEEKGEIFRKIFNTVDVLKFQERLVEKAKENEQEIENIKLTIKTRLNDLFDDEKYQSLVNRNYINYNDLFSYTDSFIDSLKEKETALNNDLLDINNQINYLINEIDLINKNNEMLEKKNRLKAEFDELNNSSDYYQGLKNDLSLYDTSIKLKNALSYKNELEANINYCQSDFDNLKSSEETLLNQKNQLASQMNELSSLKEEYEINKFKKRDLFVELEKSKNKLAYVNSLNAIMTSNEELLARKNELLDKYQSVLMKDDELQISKESSISKSNNNLSLYQTLEKLKEEQTLINEIYEKYILKDTLKSDIKELEDEYEKAHILYLELSNNKSIIKKSLESTKAYELAKDLVENAPCPVCGATHHPRLAAKIDTINTDSLEEISIKIGVANNNIDNLVKALSDKKRELINVEDYFYDLMDKNSLYTFSYICDKKNDLDSAIMQISEQINQMKETESFIHNLDEEIKMVKEELRILDDQIKEIDNQISVKKEETIRLKVRLEELSNARSEQEVNKEIDDVSNMISSYENKWNELNNLINDNNERILESKEKMMDLSVKINNFKDLLMKNDLLINDYRVSFTSDEYFLYVSSLDYNLKMDEYNNYQSSKMALLSQLQEISDKCNNITFRDASSLVLRLNDLSLRKDEIFNERSILSNDIMVKEERLNEIKSTYRACEGKVRDYETILKLSRIANGNNSPKISFEKYILAVYYEEILSVSNELLAQMTKNRYQLFRRDDLAKGNRRQGLETLIYDSNTAKLRDIKTISGGESFKASLCLALALSEVIRRRSSLVSINTLFIDEGFGSLDPDSLDSALEILDMMKNNNRVIGIISHVSELKSRIHSKIVLEPSMEGSNVKVLV